MDVMAAVMRPLARTSVVVGGRRNIDPQDRFGPLEAPIRLAVRRFTDIVVANASAAAASAVAQGVDPAKIRIIRNGVEPAAPQSPSELAALRRAMGVDDGDVLIGCVAHYRAEKGHATLIDAVAALIREGLPVRLELVGEGPMRPALERQIRDLGVGDRVTLHGSEPDPLPLYGAFDLVVSGSLREGLPNALLEAGAAGRAVIATAAGGSGEVVLDGQTGLIVPIQDAPALASALRHVVTNTALRDRLGAAGRERVATVFGMDRFVAEFAALYEELADGHQGLGGRSHGRGTA
jgi:glycosyltransferase involved in cell wall biosynthesis